MANQLWVTCKQVSLFSWKQSSERRWKNTEKWIRRSSSAIGDLLRTLHWALQSALPFQPRRLSCVVSAFSEKCYETVHLRYYDIGESWGRIHLRNVEQCTCVAGEIKCERVHYTSKTCFLLLLFCSECVQFFFFLGHFLLFLGWWEQNSIGCNDFSAICFDSCLNWCSNRRMTNEILLHVGMFWGLFVFTLNKHKDKNLATLATHIILKK